MNKVVCQPLKVPASISLLPRPPYSSEHNGIENLWHYLRSHGWSNRTDPSDDELFGVACTTSCQYGLHPELIQSVCAKSYIPSVENS